MIRVYHEVLPPTLGMVMYRIKEALGNRAPMGVTFVTDPKKADLQIVDAIGKGFVEEALRCDRFVILQHCYKTAGELDWWLPWWKKAHLVVSYHDLPVQGFRFLRMPWGADPVLFKMPPYGSTRPYLAITTGYDPGQEAIAEVAAAAGRLGGLMFHLGGPWQGMPANVKQAEGISDPNLVALYGACRWVAGMRRMEGFELPVVEGLLCGARPIVFDTPGYRAWFGDHVEYLPEVDAGALTDLLTDLMRQEPREVTPAERTTVIDQFGWDGIAERFWKAVLA